MNGEVGATLRLDLEIQAMRVSVARHVREHIMPGLEEKIAAASARIDLDALVQDTVDRMWREEVTRLVGYQVGERTRALRNTIEMKINKALTRR